MVLERLSKVPKREPKYLSETKAWECRAEYSSDADTRNEKVESGALPAPRVASASEPNQTLLAIQLFMQRVQSC